MAAMQTDKTHLVQHRTIDREVRLFVLARFVLVFTHGVAFLVLPDFTQNGGIRLEKDVLP